MARDGEEFDAERFLGAQAGVMAAVRVELGAGRKRSHWMWFVFPQIAGLGHSPTARHYALGSLEAARAYLAHGVLGPRLVECTELVLGSEETDLGRLFGSPDDLKFRSSMTLFERAQEGTEPGTGCFGTALERLCGGVRDAATLSRL